MYTLGEIANLIDAELVGDQNIEISSFGNLLDSKSSQIAYINSSKYISDLKKTNSGAVILKASFLSACTTNALVVKDPYIAFAKLTNVFASKQGVVKGIDKTAKLNDANIGSGCAIGKGVKLGKNCTIGANTVIEDNVTIGDNANISHNVCIMHDCIIGDDFQALPGVVIGSEGFGNARDENGKWHDINHLGKVVIGDNVSIGANTTIDRGTINNTEIHNGVRLDNLIHIAHNVVIGEDSAIAASTGIAGSTKLGERCMIGGMVGIVGHLNICDDVIVNAKSTIDKNITKPGIYTGIMPLMPHKRWQNVGIWITKLDKITRYLNIKLKNLKEK